jgi:hypothetical protein
MTTTDLSANNIDAIVATATAIAPLDVRKMFGTKCLYDGDVMLGIVHSSGLYLKIDDTTRGSYDATNQPIFAPKPGKGWTSFRLVPTGDTTRVDGLRPWLTDAIGVAGRLARVKDRDG